MIIDIHTHIFPDSLALDVVPKMAEEAGVREASDGRLSSLIASMDRSGIDVSVIQPVATKPSQVDRINHWMKSVRSNRIIPFGAFHPDFEDTARLVRELSEQGVPGIKIHPEYQLISPDDPRLFPLYELLIEENMMVLFHAGVDIGIPTLRSTPEMFARLHRRFPDLVMILAHMGGFMQWGEIKKHLCGLENVYLDTSYVFEYISDETFLGLVHAHGADRILFGTDSPWEDQEKFVQKVRQLPLSEEERARIFGLNAQTLLGIQAFHST
ncbi:MAG: amidohydrolase family protein [bacterium]|jgi:predicted TIM-barrel fold metal-dependent hydrolase